MELRNKFNVKVSNTIDSNQKSNEYGDTALLFKESMRRWGRFKYVYDESDKTRLRRAGKINLANFFLVILSLTLLLVNIKFFETVWYLVLKRVLQGRVII